MTVMSIIIVIMLGLIGLGSGFKTKNKWLIMFSILPIALGIAQLFVLIQMN